MNHAGQRIFGSVSRRAVRGAALGLVLGAVPALAATLSDWRMATGLYADVKAREVGDIVTVIIEETSEVNREASQESSKGTTGGGSANFQHPTVTTEDEVIGGAWKTVTLPQFNWDLKRDFTGSGGLKSKEDFSSKMSARVLDVLPNGNLLLEGKRTVRLQRETVEVTLTGMARPKDISSDNTVSSSRLADASIRYNTEGPIVQHTQPGLFVKLVNWINPF